MRTASLAEMRSAISLVPDTAKWAPAVVAFAGAVSLRLSRTKVLYWAAVKTLPDTAVMGAVQAKMLTSLSERHHDDAAGPEVARAAGHPVLGGERVRARVEGRPQGDVGGVDVAARRAEEAHPAVVGRAQARRARHLVGHAGGSAARVLGGAADADERGRPRLQGDGRAHVGGRVEVVVVGGGGFTAAEFEVGDGEAFGDAVDAVADEVAAGRGGFRRGCFVQVVADVLVELRGGERAVGYRRHRCRPRHLIPPPRRR